MAMSGSSSQTTSWLRTLFLLTRARISVMVTLTTATGYILAADGGQWRMWLPVLGVFLLASGSSALNQCQDARIDARMKRTQGRPIPSGSIESSGALFVAGLLILLGLFALSSVDANSEILLLLGGFALFWYNGVYTYLKRITAFAVVPGALIGSVPPVIGYAAAGGATTDPVILLVASFFFVWQVPHFWLLLLIFGGEYGEAGLPTLTHVFSRQQLVRITFMWILATAASGLAFPVLVGNRMLIPWSLVLVIASFWLALKSAGMLRPWSPQTKTPPFRAAFVLINVYALLVMVCLSLSALGTSST